jgi:hypothetical protein
MAILVRDLVDRGGPEGSASLSSYEAVSCHGAAPIAQLILTRSTMKISVSLAAMPDPGDWAP